MKPLGWRKMYKEENSSDKMPKKTVKSWKRGSKQVVKKEIRNEK